VLGATNLNTAKSGFVNYYNKDDLAHITFSRDEDYIAEVTSSEYLTIKDISSFPFSGKAENISKKLTTINIKEDDRIVDFVFDSNDNLWY
jgi:hypothetical protein